MLVPDVKCQNCAKIVQNSTRAGGQTQEKYHMLDQQAIAPHFIAFIIWDDTVVSKTLFMHVLFMQQVKPFPPAADGHRDIPTRPR